MIFNRIKDIENLIWQLTDELWEIQTEIIKIRRILENEDKRRVLERSEGDRKHNKSERNAEEEFTVWT